MGNSHSKKPLSFEKLCELQEGSHTDKTKFVNIIAEVNKLADKKIASLTKTKEEIDKLDMCAYEEYHTSPHYGFKTKVPADVLAMRHTLKDYLKSLYALAYGSYDGLELDETDFGYS
jgi:hypothetical protein